MRELEDQIKELSEEWQSKFVEVIRRMLDKELQRLKKEKKLPRESLDQHIAKFRAALKNGSGDARTHFSLGGLYDQKGDGANAIIHTRKAEKLFIEKEDIKGVAEARRRLRIYYEKYGYRPEDFDLLGK